MRKVALYALIMLGLIGAIALLPGHPTIRAKLLERALSALPPSTTITYDSAAGNLWTGVRFTNVRIHDDQLGSVHVEALNVSYYLPAVLGGELPLTVAATNVVGDISLEHDLPALAADGPTVAVLIQDVNIAGFDLTVNGVPFALAALEVQNVHITQPNPRTVLLAGTIASEYGAVETAAQLDLSSGVLAGDIVTADLGFVRTWWPLLTAGSGHGSFRVDGSDITATLFVTGAELDIVDLGLTAVAGVVTLDYPVLDFAVQTAVLGGSAEVAGTVDFAQSYFHVEGPAVAPLQHLADWIGRASLPAGVPANLTGNAEVQVVVDGWNTVQVEATGHASGTALGYPLELADVAFTYYPNGRMRLDAEAEFTGEPMSVRIRPEPHGSVLTVDAPRLSLFTPLDAALELRSVLDAGTITATGALHVPLAGDTLAVHVDLDGAPGAYSLFTSSTLSNEEVATGAFAIDGIGELSGQLGLAVPAFPGQPPIVATGTVRGNLTSAAVTINTESPERLLIPVFGTDIDALDLRGSLQANVDTSGFYDITGQIGGLTLQRGEYVFASGGYLDITGTAQPVISGVHLPLRVHEVTLRMHNELSVSGSLGVHIPELPSVANVTVTNTGGDIRAATADGTLHATYGPRGLRIDGVDVPVAIAGTEVLASIGVRQQSAGYVTELTLPAATEYGGVQLRNQLHLAGTIDPAQGTSVHLAGSSGGVPLRADWEANELTLTALEAGPFTVRVAGTTITATGNADAALFDALFCLESCADELGLAGPLEANVVIDAERWTYEGGFSFAPVGLPLVLTATATDTGGLAVLIGSGVLPSLSIRSHVPAGTPPAEVLNEVLSALTLDAFGAVHGSGVFSGNTVGVHGAVAPLDIAGVRVPELAWDVAWNVEASSGVLTLPGGELRAALTAEGIAVQGEIELPIEAGGIPFFVHLSVPPSVVRTPEAVPLTARISAADGTELLTLRGTAQALQGTIAISVAELGALAGAKALADVRVDGAHEITGTVAVRPFDQYAQATVALGTITAEAAIQNGLPVFRVAAEQAEITMPGAPPLILAGNLDQTTNVAATLTWATDEISATAQLHYENDTIVAELPAANVTVPGAELTGSSELALDLRTQTLTSAGGYEVTIGGEHIALTLHTPTGKLGDIGATARWNEIVANWHLSAPAEVQVAAPDIALSATLGSTIWVSGSAYGHTAEAEVHLSPTLRATLNTSAVPGTITATYTDSLELALLGNTPVTVEATPAGSVWNVVISALGETVHGELHTDTLTAFLQHEFGIATIDLRTLAWNAELHATAAGAQASLSASGTGLHGTLSGTAEASEYTATIQGELSGEQLTLIAESGNILGSTVLATYQYALGTPLAQSRVNLQIRGALRGGGTTAFVHGIPTLHAVLISDVLPRSQITLEGTLANELTVSATGSGNIRGRVLYQNGHLSGRAQLHHAVGDIDLAVIQNELHVSGSTPYIPGGSLLSIIPLTGTSGPIVLDGLGAIRGEVQVDLAAQQLVLNHVTVQQDAFSLSVHQEIPFAGPYELAGEIQLGPLTEVIPVRAGLHENELRLVASGATGEMRATIPTAGALTTLPIVFDNFALPLAGAEALPLTGSATLRLGATLTLDLHEITANDIALVGPEGLLANLTLGLAPDGSFSARTGEYTFGLRVDGNTIALREHTTGATLTATIETTLGTTRVSVTTEQAETLFRAFGVPVQRGQLAAEALIGSDTIEASLTLRDVQLETVVVAIPEVSLNLAPTPLADALSASLQLAAEVSFGAGANLELIGNVFLKNGVPAIEIIASTGQQLSGTVWPLDLAITSVGAVHGTAHVGTGGAEISELLIELANLRVLIDGYVRLGEYPSVQLLGQVAYRDAGEEYPATLFAISGEHGKYTAELGNDGEGITAEITLSESWEPTARIRVNRFVAPIPELSKIPISGEVLYSTNTITGSLDARIGTGSVRVKGALGLADLSSLLTGRSASTAEIIVQQVPIEAIPFMPDFVNIAGAFSGTIFLRGGTVNGQLVIPDLALIGDPIYTELQVHGANGRIDASLHALGSVISASFEHDVVRAAAQLEQFPLHEVLGAVTGFHTHDIHATAFARVEYPVTNPAGAYARVATEAISITNQDGLRGSVNISGVLENERIDIHTLDVTGLGSWSGNGVLSADELDFSLQVTDANLDALLALIPALRPFEPGISGSFTASAKGSVTEPRITFNAPSLALRVAGSHYEAAGTDLHITPNGLSFASELSGSAPLAGRLALTGSGQVGAGLFDLTGVEVELAGDLAIPTVGIIDNIAGTIRAETGASPTIELSGYLGNRLDVVGTLAPLDVQLSGQDVRLSLPVLMVQDTRLQPNVRVFMDSAGLAIAGSIQADFLTLDPGLRADHLQQSEEAGSRNPFAGIRIAGLRLVVPQRLSFVNSLATIEGAADLTLYGPLTALEVEGSATALRGAIRFSGRDFELVETAVTFNRAAGIYPHVRIVARTHIEKSRITSDRSDITFTAPLGGPTFAIDLVIAGDVTPAPLAAGGFTFDIAPRLSSDAVLEITSETGGRTTHTFSNDELLTLAVLGRLDLASSVAGSGNLGSVLAQGVIDSALDVLIVSELERVLKAELGIDLLELRTSSLSALTSAGAEPFGVSLKVGGYLDDGLFATYQISTLDRGNYGPVLMNQIGLQYDVGPVVFDVAARVYSPNDITLFETVPELGLSVRYDISTQLSATGAIDLSAERFAVRFGTTFVW